MHGPLFELRNAGAVGWLIVLVGVAALLLGIIALLVSLTNLKRGWALALAVVTVGVVSLGLLLGPIGAALGMRAAEAAVSGDSVDLLQKERILHEAFDESRSALHLALLLLGLPTLLAIGALCVVLFRVREGRPLTKAPLGLSGLLLVLLAWNVVGSVQANPYRNLSGADADLLELHADLQSSSSKTVPCNRLFSWIETQRTTQAPNGLGSIDIKQDLQVCVTYFMGTSPRVVAEPLDRWKALHPGRSEPEIGYDIFARSTYLRTVVSPTQQTDLLKAGEAYRRAQVQR
jgi:hypothetical protein